MSRNRQILNALLVGALVMVVAIPSAAVAKAGAGTMRRPAAVRRSAAATGTPVARVLAAGLLETRIEAVLKRRTARFDAVAQRISARITKVSAVADKVDAAGGDVTTARSLLASAKQHLGSAKVLEDQAAAAFRAIPSSSDRKAAFADARAIGRSAAVELAAARKDLRSAVVDLRSVVASLRASAQGATGSQ
jgi:hypothetical protein